MFESVDGHTDTRADGRRLNRYTISSLMSLRLRLAKNLIVFLRENKAADQLCGNRSADQRLCFRKKVEFLYLLNPKFQASKRDYTAWFLMGLFGNPRRIFSRRGSYG